MHRPHVSQRLCAQARERAGNRGVLSRISGPSLCVDKIGDGKERGLVREIMKFVRREKIALVRFEKGVRKDEIMKKWHEQPAGETLHN